MLIFQQVRNGFPSDVPEQSDVWLTLRGRFAVPHGAAAPRSQTAPGPRGSGGSRCWQSARRAQVP